MSNLILNVKKKWFDLIKSGEKDEEYRLIKKYWTDRLVNKNYDFIVITLGYPRIDEPGKRIFFYYNGFKKKVVTSEEWGNVSKNVYAIDLTIPRIY